LNRTFADTMNATASAFGTLADERHDQREEMRDLKTEVAKLGGIRPIAAALRIT